MNRTIIFAITLMVFAVIVIPATAQTSGPLVKATTNTVQKSGPGYVLEQYAGETDAVTIHVNFRVTARGFESSDSFLGTNEKPSPVIARLGAIPGVKDVSIEEYSILVFIGPAFTREAVLPKVLSAIAQQYTRGRPLVELKAPIVKSVYGSKGNCYSTWGTF